MCSIDSGKNKLAARMDVFIFKNTNRIFKKKEIVFPESVDGGLEIAVFFVRNRLFLAEFIQREFFFFFVAFKKTVSRIL